MVCLYPFPLDWNKPRPINRLVYTAQTKTPESIQRIILADTLADVLGPEGDTIIPLFLPTQVVSFANDTISKVLEELSLPNTHKPLTDVLVTSEEDGPSNGNRLWGTEDIVHWRINAITVWQLIDRRIDECVAF